MRAREPRQQVIIRARIRCGAVWGDACIRNISSRGLGLQTLAPPVQGAYVELRRGSNAIIARVVWVDGHRFGVSTQDVVSIAALTTDRTCRDEPSLSTPTLDRKATAVAHQHQFASSRAAGRAIEFAFLAILMTAAASAAYTMASDTLGRPIAAVEAALS